MTSSASLESIYELPQSAGDFVLFHGTIVTKVHTGVSGSWGDSGISFAELKGDKYTARNAWKSGCNVWAIWLRNYICPCHFRMNRTRFVLTPSKIAVATAAAVLLLGVSNAAQNTAFISSAQRSTTNILSWSTNGPAVFATVQISSPTAAVTNTVFHHYVPKSLNNLVWTNFIAHTNGRNVRIWATRSHPPGWPTKAPIATWNTNCLIWGRIGLTALSPCWQDEYSGGQIPVTALSRRHGYTRGHGMGLDGFTKNFKGKKVWFVTANNTIVQTRVAGAIVRTVGKSGRDYTILLFKDDLPPSIQPMRVIAQTNLPTQYPGRPGSPRPFFKTEQLGNVSAEVPGFTVETWKGGDSGSPDMLPMPNELVFFGGRSTSGPSAEMQSDMDELCTLQGLNPKKYQLQWVDLSGFPSYPTH
jgi:hypothetical protein